MNVRPYSIIISIVCILFLFQSCLLFRFPKEVSKTVDKLNAEKNTAALASDVVRKAMDAAIGSLADSTNKNWTVLSPEFSMWLIDR